jgi:hypothetical protein
VRIDVDPGSRSGSDPKSLVEYAKQKKENEDYSDVWCVFDDDGRPDIEEALNVARNQELEVAFSNPCFELWYLLHYEYSTQPCNQSTMLGRLKKHVPDYTKARDMFALLPDQTSADAGARKLRIHHITCGNDETGNPSTSVDKLVRLLYSIHD